MSHPPVERIDAATPVERHVLVVNQHGDNTGDEAAVRAMFGGLERRLGPVRFTVLHQFRERSSEVETDHSVRWLPLVVPRREAAGLVLHALGRLLGLRARGVLGPAGRSIVDAYESADVVVSAPGGPYFGDTYWSHEPVHWFYVWLARLHRTPVALYAPSAGPFRLRFFNPLRRVTYRCFGAVSVREERSADYVRELMRNRIDLEVTIDAALQEQVEPMDRGSWVIGPQKEPLGGRFLLVVAAADRPYPGDPDPAGRRATYDAAVVAAVRRVATLVTAASSPAASSPAAPVHVAFMPQLHSAQHSDAPYLRRLGEALGGDISWEVVEDGRSSEVQRSRFAAADLVIAGRYHPAVFAVSAGVPVLCVPYEHKAAGLMEAAGQAAYVVDLDEVTPDRLVATIETLMEHRDEVAHELSEVEPALRRRSARTNDLVARLLRL